VWLSYWAAHTLFPECRVTHLGVPILLAFFPQDIFYSVNSDVLTPLLFAVAFVGLMRIVLEDWSMAFHVLTGLAVSAAFLTTLRPATLVG